jgi:hypothetical protein
MTDASGQHAGHNDTDLHNRYDNRIPDGSHNAPKG